jgi:outer membrane protein assembly factor BamA
LEPGLLCKIKHLYNGAAVAIAVAMRRLILFCIVLFLPYSRSVAAPQQAPEGVNPKGIVESAEISGIDPSEISEDVRDAIHMLQGKPFDQNAADELIVRIQAENPAFTATARLAQGSQSNSVKLFFAVQKNAVQPGTENNVNSRYTVERVDVVGAGESKVSQTVRDEMQTLVGERLDQDKANQILHEINRQLRPKYKAKKKLIKGLDPQHVVLVYEINKERIIPYVDQPPDRVVYHSKQNFSIDPQTPIDIGHYNQILLGASNDQDLLIERFAGFNFGFESTKVGTDHLGVALRYARYHNRWQPATVLADRNSIYRERNTFDPSITVGFDPRLRLNVGASLSDLQIQYPLIHRVNDGALVASLSFNDIWPGASEEKHKVQAEYDFRSGNHTLDSDFIYTRHLVQAQYVYGQNKNWLALSFLGGRIFGNAPLFERFSLGNTSTLRGWNKFDVAPAGGNQMVYGSVQYGFGKPHFGNFNISSDKGLHFGPINPGFHVFYDVGAVGNSGSPMVARHAAGFGIGGHTFFMELGFPIRSSNVEPIFSTGLRF